jgi:hypothetical protein
MSDSEQENQEIEKYVKKFQQKMNKSMGNTDANFLKQFKIVPLGLVKKE